VTPELTEQERAAVIAKYGPVMSGELHIDLETGKITGDGPMLAFWNELVLNYRQRIVELMATIKGQRQVLSDHERRLNEDWLSDAEITAIEQRPKRVLGDIAGHFFIDYTYGEIARLIATARSERARANRLANLLNPDGQ
jgi:hypothetical protein